ncbi:hypothetical protein Q8G35_19935 [Peribacillus simplex]|uniref:Lipoprotein n=2 Tax=Peribacillus TaxID=2675229 RepID=A0AA90PFB2_9BACI|nr:MULTISPECIES: hypothetical protein [Peribacillus]MDP1420590.1 hypothetical protein [Peribacillus simplex]MDP1453501.1 hypothetical protein [Peribacillus frigoritolerans]
MRKLLWSFSLVVIIVALGGCSSSSKTSGYPEVKDDGYQIVEYGGLSDNRAVLDKDNVKKIEDVIADVSNGVKQYQLIKVAKKMLYFGL